MLFLSERHLPSPPFAASLTRTIPRFEYVILAYIIPLNGPPTSQAGRAVQDPLARGSQQWMCDETNQVVSWTIYRAPTIAEAVRKTIGPATRHIQTGNVLE